MSIPWDFLIFSFLFSTHLQPSIGYIPTDIHDITIIDGVPLTTTYDVEIFFTFPKQKDTHALTNIRYCEERDTLVLYSHKNPCTWRSYQFSWLMSRFVKTSKTYQRTVWMSFRRADCKKLLDHQTFHRVLERNNYNSIWIGFRIVPGPNAEDPSEDQSCMYKKRVMENQAIVLMFDEQPLKEGQTNPGYTEEQLCRMYNYEKNQPGRKANFVALDVLYLTGTSYATMKKCITRDYQVLIYQLDGQELPNPIVLYNRFVALRELVQNVNIGQFLPLEFRTKYLSYLPKNNWQVPAPYRGSILNQVVFNDLLAGYPLTKMDVWTIENRHLLNDKADHLLQIPLQRALPFLSKE